MIDHKQSDSDSTPSLETLSWTVFQDLCEELLCHEYPNARIIPLTLEGSRGADGVDFIVEHSATEKTAYQIKRDRSVSQKAKVHRWIDAFLNGRWREQCSKFVILSAYNISPQIFHDVLNRSEQTRVSSGVTLEIEGPRWFNNKFTDHPDIVGRFFGHNQRIEYERRAMCRLAEARSAELKSQQDFTFERFGSNVICRGYGFYFNAHLPDRNSDGTSALFMFHEPGLYSAMPTLGNDEMLRAIDTDCWRDGIPLFVGSDAASNFLQIGNVRLGVPKSTLVGFTRGMRMLSEAWQETISEIDLSRETRGYQYVDNGRGVIIGRIDARLWQAVLEYANAHDYSQDDGSERTTQNIFEPAHSMLKVFSKERSDLRAGYHAILRTMPSVELGRRSTETMVDLVWTMPPSFWHNTAMARREWWPANMTAAWIEETLLPNVWQWVHRDQRTRWEKLRRILHDAPHLELKNYWYKSRAKFFSETVPRNRGELTDLVDALQRHFSLRNGGTFPETFLRSIDQALLRLLERSKLEHWSYLRSKGELEGTTADELTQFLRKRIDENKYSEASSTLIEWRLRTFGEICEKSTGDLDSADAEAVALELRTLCINAERENVRLAHLFERCAVFPK